jgi:hypothetical protein
LFIELLPFSLRVDASAVAAFELLSPRERSWLYEHLSQSGQEGLAWSIAESIDAPHDLWVLHQWHEVSQTMDIRAVGYFPSKQSSPRSPAQDEERWDNEGGRNPAR